MRSVIILPGKKLRTATWETTTNGTVKRLGGLRFSGPGGISPSSIPLCHLRHTILAWAFDYELTKCSGHFIFITLRVFSLE